ncbi:MAG TPA: hypothetical protein DCS97_12775 [Planctomycetes bacterium]|nr:hypothetical protein [Planctomycetota bacterium]
MPPTVPRLGHALIDGQHQRIQLAAKRFLAAARRGRGRPELTALIRASTRNFASEERLMRASRYPLRAGHISLHQGILADMHRLRSNLRQRAVPHRALVAQAVDWLAHHADEADRRLVGHLAMYRPARRRLATRRN